MAAINRTHSTQFLDDMIRRKDRINFTVALQDRRQWPALGQSADSEQKKKHSSGKPDNGKVTASSPATTRRAHLQSVSSSASSSNAADSDKVSSDHAAAVAPDVTQSSPDRALHRHTSSDHVRKKSGKTKWIPLELPRQGHGLSLQEKLRMRRRQEMGLPPVDRFRYPPPNYNPSYNGPVRHPNYYHNDNLFYNDSYQSFGGAAAGGRYERRSDGTSGHRRPPPPPAPKPRNVTFSKKMYGTRNKNIMYDSDYTGRECDQHSDGTADDSSLAQGYWEDGYYYAGEESQVALADWNYYTGVDTGYASPASASLNSATYSPEDYEGYYDGYYREVSDAACFVPVEVSGEAFVDNSDAVLKEMIRMQIEYYFSPENLQKDLFLRRSMSKDGWVMLNLLASFQRVQSLTQDFHVLCEAIVNSDKVEVLDNFLVRSRDHPEMWPLIDEDSRQYADYYTNESSSESDGLYNDDLSGYRLYEGTKDAGMTYNYLEENNADKDVGHIWDEAESGQYDGDYTWDEEGSAGEGVDEEEVALEVSSEMDSSFHSKLVEEMGRVSLEVM